MLEGRLGAAEGGQVGLADHVDGGIFQCGGGGGVGLHAQRVEGQHFAPSGKGQHLLVAVFVGAEDLEGAGAYKVQRIAGCTHLHQVVAGTHPPQTHGDVAGSALGVLHGLRFATQKAHQVGQCAAPDVRAGTGVDFGGAVHGCGRWVQEAS